MFAKLNFPRSVVLLSLVGSMVLGWQLWGRSQRLAEIKQEVARAPEMGQEILELGLRLRELQKTLGAENLQALQDPELYIRQVAQGRNVDVGNVELDPSEDFPSTGIIDKKWRIKPQDRKRGFDRVRISNFFYQLEASSRSLRVTDFDIERVRPIKPHEIGRDEWTFEAEITSRQRVESEG